MKALLIALVLVSLYAIPRILYEIGYDWCWHSGGVWVFEEDGLYSCKITS